MESLIDLAYVCGNPTYTIDASSGYGTRMRELCKGFEAAGLKTAIYVPGEVETRTSRTPSGRRVLVKRFVPRKLWEFLRDLVRLKADRSFDRCLAESLSPSPPGIVYECLEYTGSVTEELRRRSRPTFVLEIHAPIEEDARFLMGPRPLQRTFSKRITRALRKADAVVVVSDVIRDWAIQSGVAPERIIVLPNGVDLRMFNPDRFRNARPEPAAAAKRVVIGFVGSDLVWHRLDALIEAFAMLPAGSDADLHIVGMADKNEGLRRVVRERGLEARVKFLGTIPFERIPAVIHSFDICVMPGSNRYGSPIKIFEYGAMGKPIVAPDEPPVREVLVPEVDGILVPSGDVLKIRNALLRLVSDSGLRRTLGRSFQKKVRKNFGWPKIARTILNHLEELKVSRP